MKCRKCKEQIDLKQQYCRVCGTKIEHEIDVLEEETSPSFPNNPNTTRNEEIFKDGAYNQKPKMRAFYLVLLLIVFFPIGLFYMWKQAHFSKRTRVIITIIIAILSVVIIYTDETTASINVKEYSSFEVEERTKEPDWKEYFSIRAYGEDIEVLDSMITENVNMTTLGSYSVVISYTTSKNETLVEEITIHVVESISPVEIQVNPANLDTTLFVNTQEPNWQDYFSISLHGETIQISSDMIEDNIDTSTVSSGEVILQYTYRDVAYTEELSIDISLHPITMQMMDLGFTKEESLSLYQTLQDSGITTINSIEEGLGESIDSLQSYKMIVNDSIHIQMVIEYREIYFIGTGYYTVYTIEDGIVGHVSALYLEDERYYIAILEDIGFEQYGETLIYESSSTGKSIMFHSNIGKSSIVFEYVSYKDGAIWSYYPNLDLGYIDSPTMSDVCEVDFSSDAPVPYGSCQQEDLEILFLLISIYDQTLEDLGITREEFDELVRSLYYSKIQ